MEEEKEGVREESDERGGWKSQIMKGQLTTGEECGFYSVMGAIGSLDQGLGLDPKMSKVLSDGDGRGMACMRKGAEVGKL